MHDPGKQYQQGMMTSAWQWQIARIPFFKLYMCVYCLLGLATLYCNIIWYYSKLQCKPAMEGKVCSLHAALNLVLLVMPAMLHFSYYH
jgi:hypothetical protein